MQLINKARVGSSSELLLQILKNQADEIKSRELYGRVAGCYKELAFGQLASMRAPGQSELAEALQFPRSFDQVKIKN
jgi:hypothetical protein